MTGNRAKCIKRFVQTVKRNARSPLNPGATVRFTAGTVFHSEKIAAAKRRYLRKRAVDFTGVRREMLVCGARPRIESLAVFTLWREDEAMNRILQKGLGLLAAGVIFVAPFAYAQDDSSIIQASNQFAFDLYAQYKSTEGNIFYSPYSIFSALAMAHEGARGKPRRKYAQCSIFPKMLLCLEIHS